MKRLAITDLFECDRVTRFNFSWIPRQKEWRSFVSWKKKIFIHASTSTKLFLLLETRLRGGRGLAAVFGRRQDPTCLNLSRPELFPESHGSWSLRFPLLCLTTKFPVSTFRPTPPARAAAILGQLISSLRLCLHNLLGQQSRTKEEENSVLLVSWRCWIAKGNKFML